MRFLCAILLLIAFAPGARADGPAPRRLWERRLVRAPAVPPLIRGDTLFVAGVDRKVLCLDARGGERHWKRTAPGRVTFGFVRGDSCLLFGIASPTPAVVALECRNGRQRWSRRLDSVPVGIVRSGRSVAILEYGGMARCVDLLDGTERWSQQLKGPMAGLAVDGAALRVLGRRDSLWSLDLADGKRAWAVPVSGTNPNAPVVVGGRVLRLTYEGDLVSHDGSTGAEVARASVRPPQTAPLSLLDERRCAAVATGGETREFDLPDLAVTWSYPTGETVSAGVVRGPDSWVVACESGRVLGLKPDNGIVAWTLKLSDPISFPPAVEGDLIGIADGRGRLAVYTIEGGS